jgi:CBS domain-containing protein
MNGSTNDKPELDTTLLEARNRAMPSAENDRVTQGVFCPLRDSNLALKECECCDHYDGVLLRGGGYSPLLVCHAPVSNGAKDFGHNAQRRASLNPVSAAMTSNPVSASAETTREALIAMLLGGGVSAVPVVNKAGRPIGIVSQADALRARNEAGVAAMEIMTPRPLTISEEAPLHEASCMMARERIDVLPVVGRKGELSGLITALDLVRWFSRLGW